MGQVPPREGGFDYFDKRISHIGLLFGERLGTLFMSRIKKYPDSPVHTLSDSLRIFFFLLWRADIFFSGFAVEFAGCVWTIAVSGKKKLQIRKYPDTWGRGLRNHGAFDFFEKFWSNSRYVANLDGQMPHPLEL